jgi:hypothetical protein
MEADAGASTGPARLEVGLAQLELEANPREARRVLIRVDYLRN